GLLSAQRLGRMALITADDLREWRPQVERAPHKYRHRERDPTATPVQVDLAASEPVERAYELSVLCAKPSTVPPATFRSVSSSPSCATVCPPR
ncbi:MAG: hypothetical protein M3354_07210, partial [Chloroflexota bacterium]|nr:hypothetical protein [Chloroflexota bacterium]